MAMRARWLLVLALAGLGGITGPAMAQDVPPAAGRKVPAATSKPASPTKAREPRRPNTRKPAAIPASITTAIRELAKEFEVGKLRQKSDYFAESTNADLTPQVVIQLLNRSLGESDSMDAYIKWQLLSAMSGGAPEGLADGALDAYRNAPALQRRPGMDIADRRMLDRELRKTDDPAAAASQLDEEVRRTDALNRSVTAYRDELFTRLSDGLPAFEAALNDIYERCMAGSTPRSLNDQLATRAMRWVSRDATDTEARQFAGMLKKLMTVEIPEYYDGVRQNEQVPRYAWIIRKADPNAGGKLQDILGMADRRLGGGTDSVTGDERSRPAGRRGRQ